MDDDDFRSPDLISCNCPACEAENVFEPVTVIEEGSEELEQLILGGLNCQTCQSCGKPFLYESPLLYRDDPERCLIYFMPNTFFDRISEPLARMQQLYDDIFGKLPADEQPECRLAIQRNQFVEKIALHQLGYDDRVIEYVKYQLFQHSTGLDAIRHELLYDFGYSEDDTIRFIAFDRDTGRPAFQLDFRMVDYHELRDYFYATPEMQAELGELYNGYYVHVDQLLN